MTNSIEDLENLPDIDPINDYGVSVDNIIDRMVQNYQNAYYEATGEELTLYPANEHKLMINVLAGELFQAYEFGAYYFKQNFIRYMDDNSMKNWGANLGYVPAAPKAASVMLEFGLNDVLDFDVTIPEGTRATSGDNVFFASDKEVTITSGSTSAIVSATCTESGKIGNEYAIGQINIIADPTVYLSYVKNTNVSAGGSDEAAGDALREKVYMFPSTYSVAGPNDAYEYFVANYSNDIADVRCVTDENAVVNIYVMLKDGQIPSESYCDAVYKYLKTSENFPGTDKISVSAPDIVEYQIEAKYYISSTKRSNEDDIKDSVADTALGFAAYQSENLGIDINPDILIGYAMAAGAKRLEITSPAFQKIRENEVAICTSISMTYGGLEDD